jgi:hypothetical protein
MIFKGKNIKIVDESGWMLDEKEDSEAYERLANMLEKLPEKDLDSMFKKLCGKKSATGETAGEGSEAPGSEEAGAMPEEQDILMDTDQTQSPDESSEPDDGLYGGKIVKNKAGEVVMWFKGKDPEPGENGLSFGIFGFWPERAEESELAEFQEFFEELKRHWRDKGLPVFDVDEIDAQVSDFVSRAKNWKALIGGDRTIGGWGETKVCVPDIATGKKYTIRVRVEKKGREMMCQYLNPSLVSSE